MTELSDPEAAELGIIYGVSARNRIRKLVTPAAIIAILGVAIVIWLVFIPLAGLFFTAFSEDTPYGPGAATFDNFVQAYTDPHLIGLIWNSFVFAACSAVLTIFMGGLVAWAVERTDMPGRGLFHGLTLITFALPGLLTTMAWTLVLSPRIGWLNTVAENTFGFTTAPIDIYTIGGMVWALSSHYFPLAYLLTGPAFRIFDVRMEEAALASGARNWQVFMRVTLPMLRPVLLSTLLLLFLRGLESFEVPRILGTPGRIDVFTTNIANSVRQAPPEFGGASALSILLLAICVVFVFLYRRSVCNAEAYATITGKGYTPTHIRLNAWRWPVFAIIAALFAASLGLPLFSLGYQSLFVSMIQPFSGAHAAVTLDNYRFVLGYPVFMQAVRTSVGLAAMSATAIVALTFLLAWLAQRSLPRLGWMLDALAFLPIAIPGIVVGVSVLFAYLVLPIPIYNTIWILLVAYVTCFLPYGMRFAAGGIASIHKELEEAASASGANRFQTFARILIPLLAPVAVSAWLYIFVLAVRELGASIMLIGPGTQVLGTVSLTMWEEGGSYGAVCALGIIQIVPLIAIVTVLRIIEKRISQGSH
jgi:iron(III) transport system permease protein